MLRNGFFPRELFDYFAAMMLLNFGIRCVDICVDIREREARYFDQGAMGEIYFCLEDCYFYLNVKAPADSATLTIFDALEQMQTASQASEPSPER